MHSLSHTVAAKLKLPTSSMNETTQSPKTPSACANDASTRVTNASKRIAHPLFDPGPPVVVYNGSRRKGIKAEHRRQEREMAEFASQLDRSEPYLDRIINRASKGE